MTTRSLRFQLGLWYAGLLIAVLLLLGLATIAALRHYLEATVRDSQLGRAHQIAQILSAENLKRGVATIADEVEARFAPGQNNRFVQIRTADGKVIYRSSEPQDHSFDPTVVPEAPWPERVTTSRKVRLSNHNALLIARYLARLPNGGLWLVESGAPLEPVDAVLGDVTRVMALSLCMAVVVASAGGYFLVGRALARVDQLARSAEDISFHNLSERLPIVESGDEVERLSLSLNRMIQRLDAAFQHSKRFVADASHELRTPLTILRGELEGLLARAEVGLGVRERLGSLLEEVDRLTKIVEGLLMLSRLDAGEARGEWVAVDLAALTVSTADQMGLLAEDKRIRIRCVTPASVLVQGDRARLKQLVVNLLDNAIKYTPDGGKVTLQVSTQEGWAVLDVTDNGIGIAADAVPHVFERFYRADQARNRAVAGAGLGLAIVQSICVAHGGKVSVESAEKEGSQFRVELPLANEMKELRSNKIHDSEVLAHVKIPETKPE